MKDHHPNKTEKKLGKETCRGAGAVLKAGRRI
jgi:hypothetical protein